MIETVATINPMWYVALIVVGAIALLAGVLIHRNRQRKVVATETPKAEPVLATSVNDIGHQMYGEKVAVGSAATIAADDPPTLHAGPIGDIAAKIDEQILSTQQRLTLLQSARKKVDDLQQQLAAQQKFLQDEGIIK